ncbi:ABC transporter ATP-binding protein [Brooklawnia cerclae]|uniref:Iron complex transport system ATP-binding protein n=1 Tax=Brooklawnia cerclae TaxID=349934 RepID=A0ABX0SF90_9ACTN|nr:ABC transporter ATP-binding protein [Brooklawnia cerclae]NIH56564.1 iron complex transport system ATP-binding protein [Brooklawnia cerclae]
MSALLEVDGLCFAYPGERGTVFRDVSFRLGTGEVMCIIGPNGAGKSTLLHAIVRLRVPSAGTVRLDGADVSRLSRSRIARVVGYVTQSSAPAFGYRVLDHVVMGRAPHVSLYRTPSREDYRLAAAGLEQLGVGHLAERNYLELSGGERQQVDIARAIVQKPRLIILDEPTSALDFGNQARVLRIVRRLAADGFAVLLTTHDPNQVIVLDAKVGVLNSDGSLLVGTPAETITEESLSRVYNADVTVAYVDKVHRDVCTIN